MAREGALAATRFRDDELTHRGLVLGHTAACAWDAFDPMACSVDVTCRPGAIGAATSCAPTPETAVPEGATCAAAGSAPRARSAGRRADAPGRVDPTSDATSSRRMSLRAEARRPSTTTATAPSRDGVSSWCRGRRGARAAATPEPISSRSQRESQRASRRGQRGASSGKLCASLRGRRVRTTSGLVSLTVSTTAR